MDKKAARKSKTLWFSVVVAAIGALETAAPGTIPPGPTLVAISIVGAVLRTLTVAAVR